MPSRLGVALIVLFWAGTTAFVGYRQVLPRLLSDAPPAIRIDLSDEATQQIPARWTVWRGDQLVGTLTTKMSYQSADDSFAFTSTYRNLRVEVSQVRVEVPELTMVMRVGRSGELRGQSVTGNLVGKLTAGPVTVLETTASLSITGSVSGGELRGQCVLKSPLGDVSEPLDPVPVPAGQVLNPLQPVNRLRDVRPGLRWLVHEANPLADAVAALARNALAKNAPKTVADALGGKRRTEPLVATVADEPETLTRQTRTSEVVEVPCWRIEYRGEGVAAVTWVAVEDGKVLRQEANASGENLRLERED